MKINTNILNYLNTTRSNFKFAKDEIIESLATVLENYEVEIVIIWSVEANTELVRFDDKYFLIWDTHFWNYYCLYYQYRRILYSMWESGKDIETLMIQADCIWADILRISIQRIKFIDPKFCLLLSKYYLQYGKSNFGNLENNNEVDGSILYFSKVFMLLHEISHLKINESFEFEEMLRYIFQYANENSYHLLKSRLKSMDIPAKIVSEIISQLEILEHEIVPEVKTDILALIGLINLENKDNCSKDNARKYVRNSYAALSSFRYNLNSIYYRLLYSLYIYQKNEAVKSKIFNNILNAEVRLIVERELDYYVYLFEDNDLLEEANRKKYFNKLIMPIREPGDILTNRIRYHLINLNILIDTTYDIIDENTFQSYIDVVNFNLAYIGEEEEYDANTLHFSK